MNTENNHKDHRKRTLDKYLRQGELSFLPHQLVEMLLFFSVPRRDTNETAHRLLTNAGSLQALLESSAEKLTESKGVGKNSAALISLCGNIAKRAEDEAAGSVALDSPFRQMRYLFNRYKGEANGTVCLTLLDSHKNLIRTITLSSGKRGSPEDYVYLAVTSAKDASAAYAVLSHNHKNGERLPSVEDVYLTASIYRALFLAECRLIEHYVITDTDVFPIEGLKNQTRKDRYKE